MFKGVATLIFTLLPLVAAGQDMGRCDGHTLSGCRGCCGAGCTAPSSAP